uniref:Putative ovule protein n=1 Tax=Solanum chacoense TaxID=4108 RepID=A0A0V0GSP9_SOLCH
MPCVVWIPQWKHPCECVYAYKYIRYPKSAGHNIYIYIQLRQMKLYTINDHYTYIIILKRQQEATHDIHNHQLEVKLSFSKIHIQIYYFAIYYYYYYIRGSKQAKIDYFPKLIGIV